MKQAPKDFIEQAVPALSNSFKRGTWMWVVELAVSIVALWGLDAMLAPTIPVLDVSPSPLWLPVLVFSVLYGKGPGLAAAFAAAAVALTHGGNQISSGGDFYAISLSVLLAPTLWILAALGLGEIRDGWSQRQGELESEIEMLRVQRAAITDYTTILRDHIDTLEFCIATSSDPAANRSGVKPVDKPHLRPIDKGDL